MFEYYPSLSWLRAHGLTEVAYASIVGPTNVAWTENQGGYIESNPELRADLRQYGLGRPLPALTEKITPENEDLIWLDLMSKEHPTVKVEKYEEYISNLPKPTSQEVRETMQRIRDHTFSLKYPCFSGTGWFLDYIIPEDGKYPTKWFVATNAHVLIGMRFKNNPYNQPQPNGWCWNYNFQHTPIIISKDRRQEINIQEPERVLSWNRFQTPTVTRKKNTERKVFFSWIEDPKLFYVPLNFLGPKFNTETRRYEDYFKDFAILEIEFSSEEEAMVMTSNIYNKYYKKHNKFKRLDFLYPDLMYMYTGNQMVSENPQLFSLGYAGDPQHQYKPIDNYNPVTGTVSHLESWSTSIEGRPTSVKNNNNQDLIGFANTGLITQKCPFSKLLWGGKKYQEWGYKYVVNNLGMGPGTSGSLVTNIDGGVLGLYTSRLNGLWSTVTPLRSEGVYRNGMIVFPRYDLIRGVPGQKESYRSQLDKYYPNAKTFLRSTNLNPRK
ncbi:membrane-associated lipoprotein precursor [Candidatus Mycoplasma haematohominis]|uniref:Membrane-associated lipoprotein n=1 Tax=Candidatus Mycoplasma haematohominis TaxID=1494318 RepID=A0A478FPI9_9MOLU|nr:membrane-associated lipoprotein precursor [Candidatus Mycoplasma haemohominis]